MRIITVLLFISGLFSTEIVYAQAQAPMMGHHGETSTTIYGQGAMPQVGFMGMGGSGYGSWNYPPGSVGGMPRLPQPAPTPAAQPAHEPTRPIQATQPQAPDPASIILTPYEVRDAPPTLSIYSEQTKTEMKNQKLGRDIRKQILKQIRDPDPSLIPTFHQGYFKESLERLYKDLYKYKPLAESRRFARDVGLETVLQADEAFRSWTPSSPGEGPFLKELGEGFLDIAVGIDPVTAVARGGYEVLSGKHFWDGHVLNNLERSMAFVMLSTAGGGKYVSIAGSAMARIYRGASHLITERGVIEAIHRGGIVTAQTGRLLNRWGKWHHITQIEEAAAANARLLEKFSSPPYLAGSHVVHFETKATTEFVRVHGANNQARSWMVKAGELRELTPEQIMYKLNLPTVPTHVSKVIVPPTTPMTRGLTNCNIWSESVAEASRIEGQVQYRVELDLVPDSWFTEMREIGEILE